MPRFGNKMFHVKRLLTQRRPKRNTKLRSRTTLPLPSRVIPPVPVVRVVDPVVNPPPIPTPTPVTPPPVKPEPGQGTTPPPQNNEAAKAAFLSAHNKLMAKRNAFGEAILNSVAAGGHTVARAINDSLGYLASQFWRAVGVKPDRSDAFYAKNSSKYASAAEELHQTADRKMKEAFSNG